MNISVIKKRLVAVVTALASESTTQEYLAQGKQRFEDLARPDFVWHYLLQSFATMGRASGWQGLIGDQRNYVRITYEALASLALRSRTAQVRKVCRTAGIRMPNRKAGFILGCFDYVTELGGPVATKTKLLSLPGRDAKLQFLDAFPGIGPKYARNIMMDVYHDEFRESIALDARIKGISKALGLNFVTYAAEEKFYLDVAKQAGLNGWELDRIMFRFRSEIESRLGISRAKKSLATRCIRGASS
jgi:hypothetical protein